LGDYACQAMPDLLLPDPHGHRHPTERMALFGKRFVYAVETEGGQRLGERITKQLTGGDPITARGMHQDPTSFKPTFTLFLGANPQPTVRGTDTAIWDRIQQVTFGDTIPEAERDLALPEKLQAERAGILRWLVDGCLSWQRAGLGAPPAVRKA